MSSTTRITVADLSARLDRSEAEQAQVNAQILGALGDIAARLTGQPVVQAVTAPTVVGTVVGTVVDEPVGTPFPVLRAALKAHKAAGAIQPGITVKEAIAAGLMTPEGNLPDGTVPQVQVVVAEARPSAKARTAKQVEAAHKVAEAPRRADGTITPKREWAVREALAATGKYDRHEIDERTAQAMSLIDA